MHRIFSIFAIISQNQGFFHDMVERFAIVLVYHMTMCLCASLNTSTSKRNSKHVRNITTRGHILFGHGIQHNLPNKSICHHRKSSVRCS